MFFARISFVILFFALEAASWTIDLPEARKYLFEKNDRLENKRDNVDHDYEKKNQVLLNNRYDSNSKHHEEQPHDEYDPYAKEYGYPTYIEKKGTIHDGGEYLEGLRRSLELFERQIKNCRSSERNGSIPSYNLATLINATGYDPSDFNATEWRPAIELTNLIYNVTTCREVSRASEHVRRLAQLATKAVEELQDLAYSRKLMKNDPYELDKQENEHILKLAWFLDRLSQLTGYQPRPVPVEDDITTTTTPPPAPITMFPPEVTRQAMNCLKQNKSEEPATVRCAIPAPVPTAAPEPTEASTDKADESSSSDRKERRVLPQTEHATSEQEVLIATEERPFYFPFHAHVKKRSVQDLKMADEKTKMADDAITLRVCTYRDEVSDATMKDSNKVHDSPITLVKYFVKHKIWEGDNLNFIKDYENFDVDNHLNDKSHVIRKRDTKKLIIPEDPYQDLSKYVRNKKGVNFVKDEDQAKKIREFIAKLANSKSKSSKETKVKISKLFRNKRSFEKEAIFENNVEPFVDDSKPNKRAKRALTYERNVAKPRIPEDIFQDISYYVKNKKTTEFNPDFVEAARRRANLEQIFLRPPIQVVRQYGSNYNPAIPNPLVFGILRTAADN